MESQVVEKGRAGIRGPRQQRTEGQIDLRAVREVEVQEGEQKQCEREARVA